LVERIELQRLGHTPQRQRENKLDTWQPLGVAALNALSRLIGGRDA
jgi:hypothetical protein